MGIINIPPKYTMKLRLCVRFMPELVTSVWRVTKSLQWPVGLDGSDQPLLYTDTFDICQGAKQNCTPPNSNFPKMRLMKNSICHLNNGRLLEHFHEGALTYRTEGIKAQVPDTFVEISRACWQAGNSHG